MAKNSNKKIRRIRAKNKAVKNREEKNREIRRDSYDAKIRQDKYIRTHFYTILRDACYNPNFYLYSEEYRSTTIVHFARTVQNKKLCMDEKKALSQLIEVCKRSKLIEYDHTDDFILGLINFAKWNSMWRNNPDL
jgi:hypothetical protein